MPTYNPMTADEAAKLSLRPEAVYPFEVKDAKDATSKSGNAMIAVELICYDADGSQFTVKDWLVHSSNRWAEKKVYDFAQTTGLAAQYANGAMNGDACLSRKGYAFIGIQKGNPKDDGSGNFPDRNVVKYYRLEADKKPADTTASNSTQPTKTEKPSDDIDQDIPF